MFQVMAEAGVTRLVFSSSATVYGQPVYLPIDEEHPTGDCTNPYGKTKFFMEEIFKVRTETHTGMKTTCVIFSRMFAWLTKTGV